MRIAILIVLVLAGCGRGGHLPEAASAPRFAGELAQARSGGVYAGEVLTATSIR